MTTLQDTQRASLRVLMADPRHGLPEYSADPKTVGRVGNVIGAAAGGEERHVRGSDSHDRFALSIKSAEQPRSPNLWLWSVLLATPICTVASLAVLAYSRFGLSCGPAHANVKLMFVSLRSRCGAEQRKRANKGGRIRSIRAYTSRITCSGTFNLQSRCWCEGGYQHARSSARQQSSFRDRFLYGGTCCLGLHLPVYRRQTVCRSTTTTTTRRTPFCVRRCPANADKSTPHGFVRWLRNFDLIRAAIARIVIDRFREELGSGNPC